MSGLRKAAPAHAPPVIHICYTFPLLSASQDVFEHKDCQFRTTRDGHWSGRHGRESRVAIGVMQRGKRVELIEPIFPCLACHSIGLGSVVDGCRLQVEERRRSGECVDEESEITRAHVLQSDSPARSATKPPAAPAQRRTPDARRSHRQASTACGVVMQGIRNTIVYYDRGGRDGTDD